jgi:hypothetical protein
MSIWTILLIAWIGGFTVFHVAGGLIHLLLIFAVISLILHFVMGARTA